MNKQMSDLEKEQFKKPKWAIITDCIYYKQCRDDLTNDIIRLQNKYDDLLRERHIITARMGSLKLVIANLTSSVNSLKDQL